MATINLRYSTGVVEGLMQEWNSGTPTKVESKFDSYLFAVAAYLIDSMGFGNLTPGYSPALWPQNQSPRFAH